MADNSFRPTSKGAPTPDYNTQVMNGLSPTENQPSILESIQLPNEPDSQMTPGAAGQTGRLYSLATTTVRPSEQMQQYIDEASKTAQFASDAAEINSDTSMRMQVAQQQQQTQVNAAFDMYRNPNTAFLNNNWMTQQNPDLTPDKYNQVFQSAAQKMAADRVNYALEQEAVNNMQQLAMSGRYSEARLLLDNMENGDANETVRDMNTKEMLLATAVQKAQVASDEEGWFSHLLYALSSQLPLKYTGDIENVDIDKGVKHWYDYIVTGNRIQEESDNLWNMNVGDFANYMPKLIANVRSNSTFMGIEGKEQELSILSKIYRPPSPASSNLSNTIDNLGFVAAVVPFGKIGSIAGAMTRLGARSASEGVFAKAYTTLLTDGAETAAKVTGVTPTELESAILPSAVNPTKDFTGTVAISNNVSNTLARMRMGFQDLFPGLSNPERLSPQEWEAAKQTAFDRLDQEFGDRSVQDYDVISKDLAGGSKVRSVVATLGKKDGTGFVSQKSAQRFADSLAETTSLARPVTPVQDLVSGETTLVPDQSGQWFVKLERPIIETGFYSDTVTPRATGWLSRFFRSDAAIGDVDLSGMAQRSVNNKAGMLNRMQKGWAKTINGLAGDERATLKQVLALGESQGKWFTDEFLNELYDRSIGRYATDKEINAYHTAREINDFEYALRNDEVYKTKFTQGMQTVSLDTGQGLIDRFNGWVNDLGDRPNGRVYDTATGTHYATSGADGFTIDPDTWSQLGADGRKLVTLEQGMKLGDGTTVRHFLASPKEIEAEALREDQLGYRAGGHRFYDTDWYIKQANLGTQPDTGAKFLLNPLTVATTRTQAEGSTLVDSLEKLREAYLKNDPLAMDQVIEDHNLGHIVSADSARDLFESGKWGKDTPFELLYDRDVPQAQLVNKGLEDFTTNEGPLENLLGGQGRMYYSQKGPHLPDFYGDKAPILDPFQSINRALVNVANMSSLSDYKLTAIGRWVDTFGRYLDGAIPDEASDMMKFQKGQFVPPKNPAVRTAIQAAQAQRDIISRTLGWRTEQDVASDAWQQGVYKWVLGDDPYSLRHQLLKGPLNWWQNSNPKAALMGMGFDMKLGMFNPAQWPLQISKMAASVAINPKYGAMGMWTAPFLRFAMTDAGTDNAMDYITKIPGWMKASGFDSAQEAKMFLRSAQKNGFFDVGSQHLMINSGGPNAALGSVGAAWDDFRQAGRFFFKDSEVWDRTVSWRTGWGLAKDADPSAFEAMLKGDDFAKSKFLNDVAFYAEKNNLRMSVASSSAWQRGWMSVPTQFFSYQARMMETMLGSDFTLGQKARLLTSQAVLYGTAGVPLASWATDWWNAQKGQAPEIGTPGSFVQRGLLDNAIYGLLGQDINASERLGTGKFLSDYFRDIAGLSQYGQKSFLQIAAGASGGVGSSLYSASTDLLKYAQAETGGDTNRPLVMDTLTRLASNISTINNFLKARIVWRYGAEIHPTTGTVVTGGLPSQEAFATMLGFSSGREQTLGAAAAFNKNFQNDVQDAVKTIRNYRMQALQEPDKMQEKSDEINAFVRLLDPDVRAAALKQVHKQVPPSMYDSFTQRVERTQALEQQIQNVAGPDNNQQQEPQQ